MVRGHRVVCGALCMASGARRVGDARAQRRRSKAAETDRALAMSVLPQSAELFGRGFVVVRCRRLVDISRSPAKAWRGEMLHMMAGLHDATGEDSALVPSPHRRKHLAEAMWALTGSWRHACSLAHGRRD